MADRYPGDGTREVHKPYDDDGLTYCGWFTGLTVVDGCGHIWPCPTVSANRSVEQTDSDQGAAA